MKLVFILFATLHLAPLGRAAIVIGESSMMTASATQKTNVTVVFERCFDPSVLHVDARVVGPAGSAITFNILVVKINKLSFEAELARTDVASGWGTTTITVTWRTYQNTVALNQAPGNININYFYLSSNTLTWASAQAHCRSVANRDLCTIAQICKNKQIAVTGVAFGDNWTPVKDNTGNWMQMGDDNNNGKRLCFNHIAKYGATTWGDITGKCGAWFNAYDPCYLKGHVFCCSAA